MRTFRNTMIGALLVVVLAVAAFYFHRKGVEARQGNDYSLLSAPGDLLIALSDALSPSAPPLPPEPADPATLAPDLVLPPAADLWQQARQHYLEARYDEALPLLESSLRAEGAVANTATVSELMSRARLFSLLLDDVSPGSGLEGPALARIALSGGEPFLATVQEETADEVTFKRSDGVGARVAKRELRAHQIARTSDQKKDLAESEYRTRHNALRTAAECLDLARFCRTYALEDHVNYLLERALDLGGDGVEKVLFERWRGAFDGGRREEAEKVLTLMREFFRDGQHTRAAARASRPAPAGQPEEPSGPEPGTGIGEVGQRSPRVSNPEVNALLEEADRLRRTGHEHYLKAQPGQEDRAEHRKQALEAYTACLEIYEKVEDQWGVNLERIFKEVYERRYQLLKDTPIK